MRIGIIALLQESNTFIPQPTTLAHFEQDMLVTGQEVIARLEGAHHEVGGMLHGLEESGVDAVPLFAARAFPFGVIEAAAFDTLLERMFSELDRALPLDGVLVAPHGATVSEQYPDADGHWLSQLRKRVGPSIPIIGTLDPHGNLSRQMVDACNALIAYRTNPHLDQRARGIDAARMIVETVTGHLHPKMAAAFPPLAINIEKQCTSEEPCHALYHLADEQMNDERVLSNSIMLGFPWADVAEMGSAVISVTDADMQLAEEKTAELARYLWQNRQAFVGNLIGIDEALDRAARMPGPVCLLDMGDNVGGGSPGDGTLLALAMYNRQLPRSFVCLYDPESVAAAISAGVGSRVKLRAGGKCDEMHGAPLDCEATVVGLYDGKFSEPHPRHGGWTEMDQGPTAVVQTDAGLTLMLTTRRVPPFSLRQITTFGIDPAAYHLIVAKGVNAPLAAYREVCPSFIRVNTPGCTTADLLGLTYLHRRRPMFPFEADARWDVM